ncbi:hypothetical protein HK097_005226, partial [Rhizophlyctis rosea]
TMPTTNYTLLLLALLLLSVPNPLLKTPILANAAPQSDFPATTTKDLSSPTTTTPDTLGASSTALGSPQSESTTAFASLPLPTFSAGPTGSGLPTLPTLSGAPAPAAGTPPPFVGPSAGNPISRPTASGISPSGATALPKPTTNTQASGAESGRVASFGAGLLVALGAGVVGFV